MGLDTFGFLFPFQDRKSFCNAVIKYSWKLVNSCLPIIPLLSYCIWGYSAMIRHIFAILFLLLLISCSKRVRICLAAINKLTLNVNTRYVARPSETEVKRAGGICAICRENFSHPTRLQCSHIFCTKCIVLWLDKESTCPICRSKAGTT